MTPQTEIGRDIIEAFAGIRRRYEGCDIAGVRMATIALIETRFNEMQERIAACTCEHHATFDLVAHEQVPSRANPFAAAAALHLSRQVL